MGIGAGLIVIGGWVTAGAAGTGILAGVIGGAIVGAAIGGLTSAIMGGNIMQGVLFGAIGGAVTGGMAGYAATGIAAGGGAVAPGAGATALATGMSITETAAVASGTGQVVATTSAATTASLAASTTSGALGKFGMDLMEQYGGDWVKGIAGAYMDNKKMDATTEAAAKAAQDAHAYKMAELKESARLAAAAKGGGGSSGPGPDHTLEIAKINDATNRAQLAENRRQYDVGAGERSTAREDLQEKEANRRALFSGYGQRGAKATPNSNADQSVLAMRQANNPIPVAAPEDDEAVYANGQPLSAGRSAALL